MVGKWPIGKWLSGNAGGNRAIFSPTDAGSVVRMGMSKSSEVGKGNPPWPNAESRVLLRVSFLELLEAGGVALTCCAAKVESHRNCPPSVARCSFSIKWRAERLAYESALIRGGWNRRAWRRGDENPSCPITLAILLADVRY